MLPNKLDHWYLNQQILQCNYLYYVQALINKDERKYMLLLYIMYGMKIHFNMVLRLCLTNKIKHSKFDHFPILFPCCFYDIFLCGRSRVSFTTKWFYDIYIIENVIPQINVPGPPCFDVSNSDAGKTAYNKNIIETLYWLSFHFVNKEVKGRFHYISMSFEVSLDFNYTVDNCHLSYTTWRTVAITKPPL